MHVTSKEPDVTLADSMFVGCGPGRSRVEFDVSWQCVLVTGVDGLRLSPSELEGLAFRLQRMGVAATVLKAVKVTS